MGNKFIKAVTAIICVTVLISVFCAAGFCRQASSGLVDNPDYEQMDQYIQQQMKDCRIPGFSVGIIKGDQALYEKGYGSADNTGRAVDSQTPFLVGSVSKTFTALAVMQLAEAGKVDLDKPVQSYLASFTLADAQASGKITVRQLLNHTSGIAEGAEFQAATLRGDDETITELVQKFRKINLSNVPGRKFEYGNANFIILGELIQKVSGLTYEEYIQKNIFNPLGMNHSFTSAISAGKNGLATGYRTLFGFPQASGLPYRKDFLPAYSIISCAEDMTYYMMAMMNGGQYNGNRILSSQGIAEMTKPSAQISRYMSYSLGWYVTSGSIYHGGELPDYQAKVKLLPEDRIGVVLMYNTSSSTATTLFNAGYRDRIETGIINVLYGVPPTKQPGQNPMDLNSYPMALTYGLMLGLAILAVLLLAFSAWRLRTLPRRLGKSTFTFWRVIVLSALVNVLLPLYILIAVPAQANASWAYVLYYIPDVGWFALVASALLLGLGVLKGIIISRHVMMQKFRAQPVKV